MLGRQQIVGIPTAIHELFKNAHDAYADHVEVDYFRSDGSFVLRDDGYGMTREEFENKWLTIGTESRYDANILPMPEFLGKHIERRPILGEKGIGRLAIASIGPQVLVLTRAIRKEGLHDMVVSFIHWGLFEIPGIDLSEINIPIITVPDGELPNLDLVESLISEVRENVKTLSKSIPKDIYKRITSDLEAFDIDPSLIEEEIGGLSLKEDGHGTHFYIFPTDHIIESDIDEESETAAPLLKTLLGFSNTMLPDRPAPPIQTSFRDHHIDGNVDELIGEGEFFTPEEFQNCSDHHFVGDFNEYGQFEGQLFLYKQPPVKYQVAWPHSHGRKTSCGPFKINLAYVQGNQNESRLPSSVFAEITAKLSKIGGLYLYKDGIRILPYGNTDYDFLKIEVRRAKAHKDWFFTFRRMMGVVETNCIDNPKLIEKAGREGFQENKAYRELRGILENFFKQLAIDYFRKDSVYGEEYWALKNQFVKDDALLKKKEKQKKVRKAQFSNELDKFFQDINNGEIQNRAMNIIAKLTMDAMVIETLDDPEEAARQILNLESTYRDEIRTLRSAYSITKPRGIGLSKSLLQDWEAYQQQFDIIEKEVFQDLETKVRELLDKLLSTSGAALDRRRRIDRALSDEGSSRKRDINALSRKTRNDANKLSESVVRNAQKKITELESVITNISVDFSQYETLDSTDEELIALQQQYVSTISSTAEKQSKELEAILFQIQSLIEAITSDSIMEDETAALEGRLNRTIEELDSYSDLAQVGTAVGIVNHELNGVISGIRKNFRKLSPWAKANEQLADVYSDLKTSFDHLDSYLKLFTPLSRRLNREKVDLSGEQIRKYLLDIFENRMERHDITFSVSDKFNRKTVNAFPSTLLPAFVNIVDNAIYWMTTIRNGERELILDADEESFILSNTGPGIEPRHADRIFDYGITLKEAGRGMGLYISRETLRKDGLDLLFENPGVANHPRFRITTQQKDNS